MSKGRGQRTDDRNRITEDRGQKTDIEVGCPKGGESGCKPRIRVLSLKIISHPATKKNFGDQKIAEYYHPF